MNLWYWFFGIWAGLLALMVWGFMGAARRFEDQAGEVAEDLADAMIEDIQARRKVKPGPADLGE